MYQKKTLKLPPYGGILNSIIQSGHRPSLPIYLHMGENAWEEGKDFADQWPERTLVLPYKHDPELYYWPVNGCNIWIFDTTFHRPETIENLALALFRDGANHICYQSPNDS